MGSCKYQVRRALSEEIEWVNDRYQEIGFLNSAFDRELIAIAEVDRVKAGLGRLVRVDETALELGGMYILPEYRGIGLASAIVAFLLENCDRGKQVFCLPFAHLTALYSSFGFRPCTESDHIPEEIRKKHAWCKERYEHPTVLFILSNFKQGEAR
jgi:GNAT superfamily N-acetyltransferase